MDAPVRVLCVDDEEYILKSLRRLLADEDLEVLTATSGEEGLSILRSRDDVGLIISDQRMPGLSGVEFLREAREIAPDAPRIMLTGYADISATIDAINKGGAFRYLSKPWSDDELILTVREGMRHYRLVSENKRLWEIVNRQNEELREWNTNLKTRVLEQTAAIRGKMDELRSLTEKLKRNFDSTLAAFSGLIELHDRESRRHCRNVADISVAAAKRMGLSAEEVDKIKVAALLHDIGKIGMPPNRLQDVSSDVDADVMGEYLLHPVRGQAAIDSVEDLRPAGILIRHHHENYDGSGFPDGLSGTDIPPGARIIAMADGFVRALAAIQADNGCEAALRAIRGGLGTRFDPEMFPFIEASVWEKLGDNVGKIGMVERELSARELKEGMILAGEVRSGTGILLLGKGETLDDAKINALKRYYAIDPPNKPLSVLVREELQSQT